MDGGNHFFHLPGYTLTTGAQFAVSPHHRKSALLTHNQLVGHQDARAF